MAIGGMDDDALIKAAESLARQQLGLGTDAQMPVYAAARGGSSEMILTFQPVDWVRTPEPLATVRGGYGMYIVGESMEPAYEPGDIALVHPHAPPRPNRDAIIFREEHGATDAMVKRVRRVSADTWYLRQFNPEQNFELKRSDWPFGHLIVGKYAGR